MDNKRGINGELKEVKQQSAFCSWLMVKLHKDIMNAKTYGFTIEGHTRMQRDIIKLRRELNDLNKMLEMRWEE